MNRWIHHAVETTRRQGTGGANFAEPYRSIAQLAGRASLSVRADDIHRKQRHQNQIENQIEGSRADDDSEPRTHKVANAIPIIPNVSTTASSQTAAKRFRCPRSDDWKTVSQNLSENRQHRVSVSLSIKFTARIEVMPANIEFLSPAIWPWR
ncbi:MAG: hypothetical protein G4V63_24115 [Candidatus Afipia apatlaquensis]|uniref:Uncharacterized protein n=1 Tax=Candidatus Afipia apatlaquensis TaxID=2712852 RepID=A0A7C9VNY3_9BRAD|nr:hypothetical protein [Candidatus Afipia apatlaquensis]